ncbi:MAG: hypothetical protein PHP98_08575 [Kiritimatiellae bacterium]|nr:hypothetical protein [Kiritimatiellia bacterium]
MRLIRVIIAVFLLPCCAAVARAVYFTLAVPAGGGGFGGTSFFWTALGLGFLLWMLFFVFLPAPVRSYVLAHELTHVLWGALMGASVLGMRVSKSGGEVKLSESNLFIALAPYFFPFYTLLLAAAWFLASVFLDLRAYFPLFLGATGFTLGFHICFTISALGRRQPDTAQYGRFFSYTLICFMNLLVIGLLLILVSPVSFNQFAGRLAVDFGIVGNFIWGWMRQLYGAVPRRL